MSNQIKKRHERLRCSYWKFQRLNTGTNPQLWNQHIRRLRSIFSTRLHGKPNWLASFDSRYRRTWTSLRHLPRSYHYVAMASPLGGIVLLHALPPRPGQLRKKLLIDALDIFETCQFQFVQIEAIISSLIDEYPLLMKRKQMVALMSCLVMYVGSVIFVTNVSSTWLNNTTIGDIGVV